MIQLNPPIPLVIVGGKVLGREWRGPKGSCMAIFADCRHPDLNIVFTVVMDEGGEVWQVEHPYCRGEANITWGRSMDRLARHLVPAQEAP